jgi:hypothetical protein
VVALDKKKSDIKTVRFIERQVKSKGKAYRRTGHKDPERE